ncbi:MAG: hypothetical protein JOY90_20855 [Bradyrhizobium sp.]|uniref:hypothetical protein n=1 Tax=Bradyrhizobium sp. TaxID=376 RepID=UPI001DCE5983|nr:hypothetical protein [Bradyrhizobium sp.]MBV9562864.1 hypothetical protein [Bradyrhizobium sp.]
MGFPPKEIFVLLDRVRRDIGRNANVQAHFSSLARRGDDKRMTAPGSLAAHRAGAAALNLKSNKLLSYAPAVSAIHAHAARCATTAQGRLFRQPI